MNNHDLGLNLSIPFISQHRTIKTKETFLLSVALKNVSKRQLLLHMPLKHIYYVDR
jgi:hypothetical protein